MDDAPDGEGAATLGVLWRVDFVRIPPRIQTKGDEVAGDFFAATQGDFSLGEAMFVQLDAFFDRFAQDFHPNRFGFRWVVVLVFGECGVLGGFLVRGAGEMVLHVGVVGGFDEPVVLWVVEPALVGHAVKPHEIDARRSSNGMRRY